MSGQTPPTAGSHQTVRISRRRHGAPGVRVGVVELAAMLAGDASSDRPASVCPVLRGFLRAYGDAVEDKRRRDLFRYAADVVGTRSSEEVTRARSERAIEWGLARRDARRGPLAWAERLAAPPSPDPWQPEQAGAFAAAHAVAGRRRHAHEHALMLVDELIAVTDPAEDRLLPVHFGVADVVGEPALTLYRRTRPARRSA